MYILWAKDNSVCVYFWLQSNMHDIRSVSRVLLCEAYATMRCRQILHKYLVDTLESYKTNRAYFRNLDVQYIGLY